MKVRSDFITNSSSSSFIICKDSLPDNIRDRVVSYIETHFEKATVEEMNEYYEDCDFNSIYNIFVRFVNSLSTVIPTLQVIF